MNKREFHNLCNHVREESEAGRFTGNEFWIGTDSKVAERIWHKGVSTDKEWYEVMLDLRESALDCQFLLHLIHVPGSRLICCGVDGLSRGDLQLEKLDGEIYIHLSVDRDHILHSPILLTWIQSWISDPFSLAEPSDWFYRDKQTHTTSARIQSKLWVWYLPLATALDALEELGNGGLKQHEMLLGIVRTSVIMQPDWFKRFVKVTDIHFFIPDVSITECPFNMYKALIFGLYFPLLIQQPWDWSQVQFMGRLGSTLSELHHTDSAGGRDILGQFW